MVYDARYWRKVPHLIRGGIDCAPSFLFPLNLYREWVTLSPYMRVFAQHGRCSEITDMPTARLIEGVDVVLVFDRLVRTGGKYTVLLNALERVCPELAVLRDGLQVPFSWRVDDIVATYSTVGSGIGYHAGHEDAFIVQAAGKRRWRVWDAAFVPSEQRRRIIESRPNDIYSFTKPKAEPLIDCELSAGDVLYIPPFFPHEGETLEESLSLAFGWKGISYYHFISLMELISPSEIPFELPLDAFDLVPDIVPASPVTTRREQARHIVDRILADKRLSDDAMDVVTEEIERILQ